MDEYAGRWIVRYVIADAIDHSGRRCARKNKLMSGVDGLICAGNCVRGRFGSGSHDSDYPIWSGWEPDSEQHGAPLGSGPDPPSELSGEAGVAPGRP